jgi:type II secretory pathway component GspD/PulD (secretin)/tetratricopeptide (TPR) repeat protein
MAGCHTTPAATGTDPWDDGTQAEKSVQAPPENEQTPPADEVAAQGGGRPASASGRLRELEKEKELHEKEKDFLVAQYLKSAKSLLDEGRPSAALEQVNKALAVKPGHPGAIEMRYRTEVLLGARPGDIGTTTSEMESFINVKIEEAKIEARNNFRKAENHYKAFEFEDAIRAFEKVMEVIRWAPYHIDLAGYRERVEAYLHRCRKLKSLERAKRLKALQAKTWEIAKSEERMAKRLKMQKVELLFKEAVLQFEQKHYSKAERLAQQVLALNPRHKLARRLIDDCIEARHIFNEKKYVTRKVEEWKKLLADFEETKVPFADTVSWPSLDHWKDVMTRKRPGSDLDAIEEDPDVARIKSVLKNQVITLDFEDTPFREVVSFIRQTKGINIVVDPNVLSEMESSGKTVNLTVEDLNLGDAMNLLLRFNNLTYTFKNKVLFVTTQEGALGNAELRLHDIRDMTQKLGAFPGPEIELKSGGDDGGMGGPAFEEPEDEGGTIQIEDLETMIKDSIQPESWDEPQFNMTTIQGMLLVSHTPEVHREISRLLDDLRKYSGLLVTVEARFLTVEDHFLEDIGVDLRGLGNEKGTDAYLDDVTVGVEDNAGGTLDNGANGNPTQPPSSGIFFNDNTDGDLRARTEGIFDRGLGSVLTNAGGLSLQYTLLDDAEINIVFHAVAKSKRATLLTAPKLTAFNTQRANITVVNQISYVKDYDVEVAQAAGIADPIMGVIQDGLVLDVRPTVSNDRKYITLELRPTVATLIRPMPTFSTTLGMIGSTTVTLHIPELVVQKAQATVRIPDGGTIVVGGLKQIRDVDRKSEIPWFAHIPILNFFTSRKGRAVEKQNLIIIIYAKITDLGDEEAKIRVG